MKTKDAFSNLDKVKIPPKSNINKKVNFKVKNQGSFMDYIPVAMQLIKGTEMEKKAKSIIYIVLIILIFSVIGVYNSIDFLINL